MTARLIEILKMYKRKTVSDEPESIMPRQKQLPVVGTLIDKENSWMLKILGRLVTLISRLENNGRKGLRVERRRRSQNGSKLPTDRDRYVMYCLFGVN